MLIGPCGGRLKDPSRRKLRWIVISPRRGTAPKSKTKMESEICEIGVVVGRELVAYVLEDEAREMIRSRVYTLIKSNGRDRRIKLVEETPENIAKARALHGGSTRAALSTTQREELYQGLRRPGKGQTPTDGPVTKVITVVRKYRQGVGFINWGENERFARRRLNPDKLPVPLYTESQLRAAMMQNPKAFGRQVAA